jgi:hypothetical protein
VNTSPRHPITKQAAGADSNDGVWPYSRQDVAYPNEQQAKQDHSQPLNWEA